MLNTAIIQAMEQVDIPKRIKLVVKNPNSNRSKKKKKWKDKQRKYANRVPKQYKVYIKSIHWEKRKNRFFQAYGKKCALCERSDHVQLHHCFYGDYGNEKDEHLIPLCQAHHNQFHTELGKVRKDMVTETLKFIKDNYDPFIHKQ